VEPAETSIAREQHGNNTLLGTFLCYPRHVPTATGMHATIEEIMEAVFSSGPSRGHMRGPRNCLRLSGPTGAICWLISNVRSNIQGDQG
jgi:hypothetical protein